MQAVAACPAASVMSIRYGQRVLLPAVRRAAAEALIISDGFSCREQILQQTDRRALHLAQVMQMAPHEGIKGRARRTAMSEQAVMPGLSMVDEDTAFIAILL